MRRRVQFASSPPPITGVAIPHLWRHHCDEFHSHLRYGKVSYCIIGISVGLTCCVLRTGVGMGLGEGSSNAFLGIGRWTSLKPALGVAHLLDLTLSRVSVGSSLSNSPGTGIDVPSLSPPTLALGVLLARLAAAWASAVLLRFWETSRIYYYEFHGALQIQRTHHDLFLSASFC